MIVLCALSQLYFSIALPIWLFFKGSVGPNQFGILADTQER